MPSPQRIQHRDGPRLHAAIALLALACASAPTRPPGDPRAGEHYAAGEELLQSRRFDEAARELDQAAGLVPAWAPARLELGWARFHLGEFAAAESDFRSAVGLDAMEPRCRQALGSALYVQGRYGEAAVELERWVDLSGGPIRAGEAAVFWALALKRAGGASAARSRELLEQWTLTPNRWVDFSGVTAASHTLTGPARTLGQYLRDAAEEEEVIAEKWGSEARRAFAGYVVAANLLAKGKPAAARERLQKVAQPPPDGDDDLATLVVRAFARADLASLPQPAPDRAGVP
ncbi:MAG TPA: hypothetical protein VFR85_05545 [Anaeromyxobacteraceae bacterium]|nr:hypothetical protein [Anaeromyxobacteraceae bacterium]